MLKTYAGIPLSVCRIYNINTYIYYMYIYVHFNVLLNLLVLSAGTSILLRIRYLRLSSVLWDVHTQV